MTSKNKEDWIPLQINVFSRWFEFHARGVTDVPVHDITKDLSSGVALIELAQSLTNSKPPRPWKHNPTKGYHEVQNCDLALEMFKNDGIKFVGISGKDIVDNNQKLILGFIWSLVLHYSISRYVSKDLQEKTNSKSPKIASHELLDWAIKRTHNYPNIVDFSPLDMAVCALLDSYVPDKIHFSTLDPKSVEHNLKLAANVMTDLGIPLYVYPEEVIKHDNHVDDKTLLIQLAAIKAIMEHQIPGLKDELSSDSEEEIKPGNEIPFFLAEKEKAYAEIERLKKELEQTKLSAQTEREIEEKRLKQDHETKQHIQNVRDQSSKLLHAFSTFEKDMNTKINDESNRIDDLNQKVQTYESSQQNTVKSIQKAKKIAIKRLGNINHAISTLQRDINAKIGDDLARCDELARAKHCNHCNDKEIEFYQKQIRELTQKLDEANRKINDQEKHLSDLQSRQDEKENQLRNNIDYLQNEKDAGEIRVEEITKLSDEDELSKNKEDDKDVIIQHLQDEIVSLKNDNEEANNRIAEMATILTDIKQMTEEHNKTERIEISQLREQISRQQKRIMKDDIEIDHLHSALIEKSQIDSTLIIRPREIDTNENDTEINELRNQLKDRDKHIDHLECENYLYRMRINEMQSRINDLDMSIGRKPNENNNVDSEELDQEDLSHNKKHHEHKHLSHHAENDEDLDSSNEDYDNSSTDNDGKKKARKHKKESLALKERKIKAEAKEKMNKIAVIRAKAETQAEKAARLHADKRCKSISELYLRTQKRESRKNKLNNDDFDKILKKDDHNE